MSLCPQIHAKTAYGVFQNDSWVLVPRDPVNATDRVRMFWAAAQPYTPKPRKKRKKRGGGAAGATATRRSAMGSRSGR